MAEGVALPVGGRVAEAVGDGWLVVGTGVGVGEAAGGGGGIGAAQALSRIEKSSSKRNEANAPSHSARRTIHPLG